MDVVARGVQRGGGGEGGEDLWDIGEGKMGMLHGWSVEMTKGGVRGAGLPGKTNVLLH